MCCLISSSTTGWDIRRYWKRLEIFLRHIVIARLRRAFELDLLGIRLGHFYLRRESLNDLVAHSIAAPNHVKRISGSNGPVRLIMIMLNQFLTPPCKTQRNLTEKLVLKKYDPKIRKHVDFKEGKIK